MSFLIVYQNEIIKIFEYKEGRFILLTNNGEEEQRFDEDVFWSWWKDKINYSGEDVAFVVLTDKEFFSLPSFIKLSDSFEFTTKDVEKVVKYIPSKINIFSYPDGFEVSNPLVESNEEVKEVIAKTDESVLSRYFQQKTEKYNG